MIEQEQKAQKTGSELRELIVNHMKKKSLSNADVARAIDKSSTAVNQWLNEKYAGRNDAIEKAVEDFLEIEAEREKAECYKENFVDITNAKKVMAIARRIHRHDEIGVIVGDAGVGKTSSLREYQKRNSGVIFVEAEPGYTRSEVVKDIHEQLGFDGIGGLATLRRDIIRKLKDSHRLLIIDEAEYLTSATVDIVRRLHDKTGGTFGIIFAGLPRLMSNIAGHKHQHAQLYSRLDRVIELDELSVMDVKEIINNNFPAGNEHVVLYTNLSNGRARSLTKLINNTIKFMETLDAPISERLIKKAAAELVL